MSEKPVVEIKDFEEHQMDELLALLTKWSPDHPELGQGDVVKWQKCHRWTAMHEGRIVGYIGQIPENFYYGKKSGKTGHEQLGFGVTLVLDMSDTPVRKQAGRLLLAQCEDNAPLRYAAVGVVPAIEEPYKRRGHAVRRDCSSFYGRFLEPGKALAYLGQPSYYSPLISIANMFKSAPKAVKHGTVEKIDTFKPEWDEQWKSVMAEKYEIFGERNAEFLNYKLTQPNRDYQVYTHSDGGYIIFRTAKHLVKDLYLVKVCDMNGTDTAKLDLLSLAMAYTYEKGAHGIVALASQVDEPIYKKAGLWVTRPYPITMPLDLKEKMHISFFDSDLDNLW